MLTPSRQLKNTRPGQGQSLRKSQRLVQDNHPDHNLKNNQRLVQDNDPDQNLTRLCALVRLLARQAAHQVYLSQLPHPFVDRLKRSDSTHLENREED